MFTKAILCISIASSNQMEIIMSNERLFYLLCGQFEKKVDIKDRLSARPIKIGIAEASDKHVSQDKQYHSKNFKF